MMHVRDKRSSLLGSLLVSATLGIVAGGCEDESSPTGPENGTTTTTAPAPSSSGLLRAAQLTIDARTVDVAVDGEIVASGLAYPGVSDYIELPAGEHRVQFFPAGTTTPPALQEAIVDLRPNEALTVAILGQNPLELETIRDDRTRTTNRARLRMFNAVPDFPASFDLSVVNGPTVFTEVAFRTSSGYEALVPGIYAFTLFRAGTSEDIAMLLGAQLTAGTVSTVFAVGSLARGDIELFIARDAT